VQARRPERVRVEQYIGDSAAERSPKLPGRSSTSKKAIVQACEVCFLGNFPLWAFVLFLVLQGILYDFSLSKLRNVPRPSYQLFNSVNYLFTID